MELFGIFILFGIAAVAFAGFSHTRSKEAWVRAGQQLGLETDLGSIFGQLRMEGTIRGIVVTVYTEQRGSGDNSKSYTVYRVRYPGDNPEITLKRQGGLSFLKNLIGVRDLVIGDPGFDSQVRITGDDWTEAQRFLTPARRMAVLSLFENWPRGEVSSNAITVAKPGRESNSDRLVSTVHRLVDMGLLMSRPDEVDVALELTAEGDLVAGTEELAAINVDEPNAYTQLLEAEARVSLGQRDEAATILRELEAILPADPEVEGWHRVADQPIRSAPSRTPAEIDLSAESVIADLFVSGRMGFEVEERFASVYLNRVVSWSGTVRTARPYRTDRDFGDQPGVKAVILIGSLGDDRLVTSRVEAVVQLPADSSISHEDSVSFTGTLSRIDRYMRNIYVTDASLD